MEKLAQVQQLLARAETKVGVSPQTTAVSLTEGWGARVQEQGEKIQGAGALGLRPGQTTVITGSKLLLYALAAQAAGQTGWCLIAGLPSVGWAAARDAGLRVTNTVYLPETASEVARALAVAVESFGVVVVGNGVALSAGQKRILNARIKKEKSQLLSAAQWPQCNRVIHARQTRVQQPEGGENPEEASRALTVVEARLEYGAIAREIDFLVGQGTLEMRQRTRSAAGKKHGPLHRGVG